MKNEISGTDLAGLKSMLVLTLSKWIENQLAPVEEHFPNEDQDVQKDVLERFLMYLVNRHGVPDEVGNKFYNASAVEMNLLIGASAELNYEDDNSATITVHKHES